MSNSIACVGETAAGLSALRNLGKSAKRNIIGTASNPIHTVAKVGNLKDQLWRTFKSIVLAFLFICGVGALPEDKGIRKGIFLVSIVFSFSFFNLILEDMFSGLHLPISRTWYK